MRIAVIVLRVLLALVFLAAGILKAGASESFALALIPFTFLPEAALPFIAIALPLAEILAGLLLLLPRVFPLGAWLVAILNVLFITVLTWALVNGIIVACNCFGAPDTPPSAALMVQAILRDIALLVVAIFIIWKARLER